ncbi:MAG: hypothetical protein IKR76_11125 [Ruminococcus sp.]|nr:hypothetical protein [Ruminococcus sp.]
MEGISQNEPASAVIPFDLDAAFLLYPVRHHSPACAYQLIKTAELYRPDVILIEGPENANELIPVLTDERTRLPAAIYYYYKDKKKHISPEGEDFRCYYPFLKSSPEYNAMAFAKKSGIPAFFIDLPYSEILINTKHDKGLLKGDKHSYADDSRLTRGQFYMALCEKTGIRSFEEFWEKYFEIEGLYKTPEEFVRAMHTYCALARKDTPAEELKADATLIREQHMAFNIKEAMKIYKRVLVVTGGFHSPGLYERLTGGEIKPVKPHSVPKDCTGCFPAAYSYEAADALHGYASGMSYPFFYDSVFERVCAQKSPVGAYSAQVLDMLAACAKKCKEQELPVAISDVTAAHTLIGGLAALRNIPEGGIYELLDGVTSCMIKGERTVSTSLPIDILKKLLTGDGVGHIGDTAHTPPLIADFEKHCELYKLKFNSAIRQEVEVSLFKTERALGLSRFMHRMAFLGTGFCERIKGADLHSGKDKSRVREVWRYRRSPQVDSLLIDRTAEGFTIEEACTSLASKRLKEARRFDVAAKTAVDCFLCGIELPDAHRRMTDILTSDGDLLSVGKGLRYFSVLYDLSRLYDYDSSMTLSLMQMCFERLLGSLGQLINLPDEQAGECIEILRHLYGLIDTRFNDRRDELYAALCDMSAASQKNPAVYGAVMGLMYAFEESNRTLAQSAMRGYLSGTQEIKKQGSKFMRGLFTAARDIVFADSTFIEMADKLIVSMSSDDFMEVLPDLRLAFTGFTPQEIQRTARAVAEIYGGSGDSILYEQAIDEGLFEFGSALDRELALCFEREDK